MKRIGWSLLLGAILPLLIVFCGSLLSFGQPFLVLQAIGDLLVEAMIWPLQLFKQAFSNGRHLSLESLIATYVFDASLVVGTVYVALDKGLTYRIRIGAISLAMLLLLCAPWGFSYKPPSEKLTQAFPEDSQVIFESSQELILYSIETVIKTSEEAPSLEAETVERFHGYRVLGKVSIQDPILRRQIKKFLYRSIDEGLAPALCFDPHHGIRAIQNGRVVDMVICFECGHMDVYADGREGSAIIGAGIGEHYYNRILQAAGIPLSK